MYFSNSKTLTEDLCKEAKDYVVNGFKSIKMKVGLSISEDLKNIKSVRNTIGFDVELMIDANHAYSFDEALRLSKKLENMDIKWFEEPLSPEFYDQYADFKSKSLIPVAAGECEYLRYGFQKLISCIFARKITDFMQFRMTNRQWQPKSVKICQKINLPETSRRRSKTSPGR